MSGSTITHKGRGWELRHSLWIGWTFTFGFFNWIGFLYAGIRAKKQAWVVWGAIYSIPFILGLIFTEQSDSIMQDVAVGAMLVVGVVSVVHAFRIRPEYLRRIAAKQQPAASQPSFYPAEHRSAPPSPSRQASMTSAPHPATTAPTNTESESELRHADMPAVIDLNTATEQQLAAIPVLGPVLAKRVIEERESRGSFASIDELGEVLNLKPHLIEKLRPRLEVVEPKPAPPEELRRAGRVVDF